MKGKYALTTLATLIVAVFIGTALTARSADAYRICTFKGTVVDHGWRSMIVKSGGQCATLNVGWRTKYIPNRRPCLGEQVAVDFILEEGYMKATKVVSLTPPPPDVSCYPPPPPSSARCRTVPDTVEEACPGPEPVCSRTPPPHVTSQWAARRTVKKPEPRRPRRTAQVKKPTKPTKPEEPKLNGDKDEKPTPPPPPPPPPEPNTITGEVVASSPKSISVRVEKDGEGAEVVNVRVGLKTQFVPFRRPAVGEKVKIEYKMENGTKFGHSVKVLQ